MTTLMQMGACVELEAQGFKGVQTPRTDKTPIPGVLLMMDEGHQKLLLVQGDGSAVDLLEVWRLADDCIRNWHREKTLPGFVGDFKRLTPLAQALNGKRFYHADDHEQKGSDHADQAQ